MRVPPGTLCVCVRGVTVDMSVGECVSGCVSGCVCVDSCVYSCVSLCLGEQRKRDLDLTKKTAIRRKATKSH